MSSSRYVDWGESSDRSSPKKRRGSGSTQQDENNSSSSRQKRGPEPDPAKISENALREAALSYLERHGGSVQQLRQVLRRRIVKYGDSETMTAAQERVEEIIERFIASKLLDDTRFSESFAESLRRRGSSTAKVRQKLITRGIAESTIAETLERFNNDEELSDEASAATYARKKRLKERFDLSDPKQRQKALASLARQGFSFDVAKRVLGL